MAFGFVLLVVVAMVAILLIAVVTNFAQLLKGRIVLNLGNQAYRPGTNIAGTLTVSARKQIGPGRLTASLVCEEEWWETSTNAHGHRSRDKKTQEVYRHDIDVDRAFAVATGGTVSAPFSLPTPQPQDTVVEGPQSGWSRVLSGLAAAFEPDRDHVWYVHGRLELPGFDLTTREAIPFVYDLD